VLHALGLVQGMAASGCPVHEELQPGSSSSCSQLSYLKWLRRQQWQMPLDGHLRMPCARLSQLCWLCSALNFVA
jgi:hypothetical protein